MLGGPKITLGAMRPLDTPSGKKLYQNEYFGISSCVFNFNFLALVVSDILGGSQIYTKGYAPLTPPSGDIFVRKASTLQYLIVFNFNFLALGPSEILGGPKITFGGAAPLGCPLAEKNFIPKKNNLAYLIAILISAV